VVEGAGPWNIGARRCGFSRCDARPFALFVALTELTAGLSASRIDGLKLKTRRILPTATFG